MPADLLPWWTGAAVLAAFVALTVLASGWVIAALISELLDE